MISWSSSLLKYLALFNITLLSLMVGIGYQTRFIALLGTAQWGNGQKFQKMLFYCYSLNLYEEKSL